MKKFWTTMLLSCILPLPSNAQDYQLIELGDLGGNEGQALSINEERQVVGYSHNSAMRVRPFLWVNGAMTDLGTLPGRQDGTAYAVNNLQSAVGRNSGAGLGITGVAWNNSQVIRINGIQQAQDINDANEVVGFTVQTGSTAQLLSNGTLTQLDLGGALAGQAYAINNAGQVVGWVTGEAALWEPSNGYALSRLGTLPGGISSYANDINSSGVIVGVSDMGVDDYAFRYENGLMHNLGAVGELSYAYAINDAGIIVGEAYSSGLTNRRGVMWINNVMSDVNTLINHTLKVEVLLDINNKGEMIGTATNGNDLIPIMLIPPIAIRDISPATAGVINTITMGGVTFHANVVVFSSPMTGQTTVGCATLDLGGQVTVVGGSVADQFGDAHVDRFVHPAWSGQQVHVQAVDQNNCAVSEVFTVTLN